MLGSQQKSTAKANHFQHAAMRQTVVIRLTDVLFSITLVTLIAMQSHSCEAVAAGEDLENGASPKEAARKGPESEAGREETVFLSDLDPQWINTSLNIYGNPTGFYPNGRLDHDKNRIVVAGEFSDKGIALDAQEQPEVAPDGSVYHTPAAVRYAVPKGAITLKGAAAIDDSLSDPPLPHALKEPFIFQVHGDKKLLWQTRPGLSKPGSQAPFSVDVSKYSSVTLTIVINRNDPGCKSKTVWIDPHFVLDEGKAVRLGLHTESLWLMQKKQQLRRAFAERGWPLPQMAGDLITGFDELHGEGLEINDIVVRVNGVKIMSKASQQKAYGTLRLDAEAKVEVLRLVEREEKKLWESVRVTTKPISTRDIEAAEEQKLIAKAKATESKKLRTRSLGRDVTVAELRAHNEEVFLAIEEFKKSAVRTAADVERYPISSGMHDLSMCVEEFREMGVSEAAFAQSIRKWTNRVRADGSTPRLNMTKTVLRTPVKDLWFEVRGEVWTAKEFWDYCERLNE